MKLIPPLRRFAAVLIALGWVGTCFLVARLLPSPVLALLAFWFLVTPAWCYLMTPVNQAMGIYTYASSFLRYSLSYEGTRIASLTLHLGTLYDLLWRVLPLLRPGERMSTVVRREIYSGLASLIHKIELGEIPNEAAILACSYYLPAGKMHQFGFARDASSHESRLLEGCSPVLLTAGYLDLMITRTVVLGRLRWFNPLRTACYRTTAEELVRRKPLLHRLAHHTSSS